MKKSGRPAFRPTDEQRETVEQMRFVGEPKAVIAMAIGITTLTLDKHFRDELDTGHAKRRREVIGYLFEMAKGGNVAATKHLETLGRAAAPVSATKAKPERKAAPVGKKEAADNDALTVEDKYQPPSPPQPLRLVKR